MGSPDANIATRTITEHEAANIAQMLSKPAARTIRKPRAANPTLPTQFPPILRKRQIEIILI
jgi:hypothetical protein